jgi:PAS domain S-box-containing protein
MKDSSKTKQELIEELSDLKKKIKKLDKLESKFKQSGAALLVSEENYRRLFETMAQGVVYQAADGKIISANPAAERILGLSLDQMQGKTSLDPGWKSIREDGSELTGKEHPAMVALRTGKPVERFIMGVHNPKNDAHTWIYVSATPLYKPGENVPFQVYATFDDITERKKAELALQAKNEEYEALNEELRSSVEELQAAAEELQAQNEELQQQEVALRESEEKYRLLFDSGGDAIFIHDEDARILAANKQACEQFGYTHAELLSMTVNQMDSPEAGKHVPERIARVIEQGSLLFEIVHQRKDGSLIPHEVSTRRIIWDGHPAIMSICRDITERKQVEEALRKSEENYRQLFDNSPAAIYQVDFRTGKFLKANDLICEYLGCSQEEITSLSPYDSMTKESKQYFSERLEKMSSGEKVTENPEFEIVDRNGKRRWLQLNAKNIYDSEGLAGADVVAHDITDRKLAEKSIYISEEKFNKAFHSSPILTAISTIEDGRFLDVNEIFLHKLLFSREEVVGKTSRELGFFANPAQRQAIKEMTEEKGYARNIELQMVTKNGQIIDGLFSADPITVNNEKCWLTVMVDVTEQKRAEEKLRESEENHRILLEESADPIFSFTPEGQYKYVNKAFAKGVGKADEDIIGKKIWDVFPKEEADKRFDFLSQVIHTGEEKTIEVRVPRADGDRYYVTTATPIKDITGNVVYAICSSKEITDRKQTEEKLGEITERLRLATSSAKAGVWDWNLQTNEMIWDDECWNFTDSRLRISQEGLKPGSKDCTLMIRPVRLRNASPPYVVSRILTRSSVSYVLTGR